ncbi:MAG TPA: molecular chaperone HtpG [Syntrophorhabdales bacterium]|nr:molecular chaperone HtpG [Syntrophorhabdales bacterium]
MSSQTMEFKAEARQLLNLVIHSLYSHKEVFLRELISNASDAIDRARYESLTNKEIQEDDGEWKIRITVDKNAGTLTVSDNGIGMTKEEAVEALGTIARSGTREFLKALQEKNLKDNPDLIGQFGVGFYASFMVADRIVVFSRRAGQKGKPGVKWESAGEGSFSVEEVEKPAKGTDVTLYLRDEDKKYLAEWEIRDVVAKYSDFIEHPIVMEVEREKPSTIDKTKMVKVKEEQTLNSQKALWLRDKSEISKEEYDEFFRHISHDFGDPLTVIHYRAEGTSEFSALLYIPSHAPFNILYRDYKIGPMLYVNRVQIMENCEALIPVYLRFIRGVVDSSDLPLNLSRELLQQNRQVEIIKTNVTKKVLDTLAEMKEGDYETYLKFHKEFGRILKEGVYFDFAKKESIADLLLFPSTKTEKDAFTTLQKYVDGMKEDQKEIYYITGTSLEEARKSPYLEAFRDKDYEVLIMLDEIDDVVMGGLEYKGKHLKSVSRGDIDLKGEAGEKEKTREKYNKLLDLIKDKLKDDVKDVRLSGRLKDSPCCLVTDTGDLDPQTEKILRAMGQEVPGGKRILEINPDHPLFEMMNSVFEKDKKNPLLDEYIGLLYDQALLLEGSKPKDPVALAKTVARLMLKSAST